MVSCDPAGLPVYSWFCQGNRENKIICNLLQNSCFIFASIDYKVRWSFTGKSYWLAKGKFRALAFLAMLSNSLAVKGIAKNKAIPYKGYNFLTEEQTWDADTARQLCRAHRAGAASWSLPSRITPEVLREYFQILVSGVFHLSLKHKPQSHWC